MSSDVASLEKWKEKKRRNKGKGPKQDIDKQRKWMDEVEEIKKLEKQYEKFDATKVQTFDDFPLSNNTRMGLRKAGYSKPTAIQQASFTPAMQGRDVLGAAKTGSGKTLAFLMPVLECLFRQRWTSIAGPGALIISPTRELAYQTFEVLKKVGQFHDFSAGLVIGGKDMSAEATRMSRTNILICTPGRILQHMDETSYFDASSLQILVLDEADRILDMGFKATINAVLENLPADKQTLLFSATQTKSVKDLARLSLRDPAYVSVHEKSKSSTPTGLNQKYIVCKLQDKMNILFSFIKTHLKTKTLIFLSSCKQVQYIHAAFCKLRPGIPTLMLHGKLDQMRRMAVYDEFCRKQFALLVCTDIAARGLDFPAIDWVVQFDCPEDAETYIHRAGRTARYHGEGHALLFLLESEKEAMLEQLKGRKVPVSKTQINTEKFTDISSRLESFCAADIDLKERAQRCFVSYIRSVFLMKNKSVFSVDSIPLAEYSASLGLAVTPRVRFLQKHKASIAKGKEKVKGNINVFEQQSKQEDDDEADLLSGITGDQQDDVIGDIFSVKRKDVFNSEYSDKDEKEPSKDAEMDSRDKRVVTKVGAIKKLLKKKYKYNQKVVFDDEGDLAAAWPPIDPKAYKAGLKEQDDNPDGIDIERTRIEMQERDTVDRQQHKMRIKQRHREQRMKDKEERRERQAIKEGRPYYKNEEVVARLERPEKQDISDAEFREESEQERLPRKRSLDKSENEDEECLNTTKKMRNEEKESMSDLLSDAGLSLQDEEKLALHLLGK